MGQTTPQAHNTMQTILKAVTDLMNQYHGVAVWVYNDVNRIEVTVWDNENNARHRFDFREKTQPTWANQFINLAELLKLAEDVKGGSPC